MLKLSIEATKKEIEGKEGAEKKKLSEKALESEKGKRKTHYG